MMRLAVIAARTCKIHLSVKSTARLLHMEMPHSQRDARSAIDVHIKIHYAIASKAYVVRLVPPSTAKPPHRFDGG